MDWCRLVGPRGLCRPLDEKQVSNKQPGPSRPVRASRHANTGQGRAGQGQGRAGQGRSPLHWCPFGVPKSEFGSLAENGRFLNKPLIWKCYFPVPAALVPMEMLFSPVPFPVAAALVPIWRPKIGIWEPCRKWSIS